MSAELSNTDKVTAYVNDAKANGIRVLPPDVNESLWEFNVIGGNIRFGMGAIKNVGEGVCRSIIEERKRRGAYKGLVDFCERVDVGRRAIESLIKVGTFDECEKSFNRKSMFENIDLIVSYGTKRQEDRANGQSDLFDFGKSSGITTQLDIVECDEYSDQEKLDFEADLMGIYVSGHPLDQFSRIAEKVSSFPLRRVHELNGHGKRDMTLVGVVTCQKKVLTKKGEKMSFAILEDLSGKIECIIFPKTFEKYGDSLSARTPFVLTGQVNLSESPKKFFPEKIRKLEDVAEEMITGVKINVKMEKLRENHLNHFKRVLSDHRGSVPLHLFFEHRDGKARLPLGDDYFVHPSPLLAARVNEVFDATDAVEFIIDKTP